MSEPLLSYIVPVFNTESYLLRCLRSIVNQGLPEDGYEVLVVDDGSTDGSSALIQSFIDEGHPQVHLLVQENAGVSSARNLALEHARGRYLYFADSDDYLLDGEMSALLNRAAGDDLDVLVFNYMTSVADGNITGLRADMAIDDTATMTGVEYLEGHTMPPYIWRYLIKRTLIEDNHWRFDKSLIVCEDGELIARFMLAAQRVAGSSSAPYCYAIRGDSAMHRQDQAHLSRRINSQIDAAISINDTVNRYQTTSGAEAPKSVAGLRNVYLFFSMTKALTNGTVSEAIERMRGAGLYPFPCVGPEANYHGMKWGLIHRLMMHPSLWSALSNLYRMIKK